MQFAVLDGFVAAWLWDSASGTFLTFFADAPAFLNNLDTLAYGDVLWVSVSADADWEFAEPTLYGD